MKLKPLVQMMAMLPIIVLPAKTALHASDLSIYTPNSGGKTAIFLMLDTSGSMGISSLVMPKNNAWGSPGDVNGTSLCTRMDVSETGSTTRTFKAWTYNLTGFTNNDLTRPIKQESSDTNATAVTKTVTIINSANPSQSTVITYHVRGCTDGTSWQYDRLSRLKDAIIPLLASTDIKDNVVMGLGQFSAKTKLNVSGSELKLIDSHSGAVLVKNAALDYAQRVKLAKKIASFQSLDNKTYGNGKQKVSIATDNLTYISAASGTAYTSNILRKSSNKYPLGEDQFKTAGGTPAAQAYAEAGAYMMGTTTGVNSAHQNLTAIDWIYDGSMTMQNVNSPYDQVHFICVELTTGSSALTSSDFKASGKSYDVKQCINNWPTVDTNQKTVNSNIVSGTYKDSNNSGTIFKPDGEGGWTQIIGQANFKKALKDAGVSSNGEMTTGWETLSKLPVGWRYGGWMKVQEEPLDIEPIVGKVWGPYANNSAYGIVAYRSNPFALIEIASTNQANSYTNNLVGGFRYSVDDSKNTTTNKYYPGGSDSSCDGNGIYFLTDGAPNSTKDEIAQSVMNYSLNESPYQFTGKPEASTTGAIRSVLTSPKLSANLFQGETGGWEYIGEYAKKLRNRTSESDTKKNPADMNIRTAVVGFGSSFDELKTTSDCEALKRANPINYNKDAYNACKWGSSEYGDGGFYYAENSEDIKRSIIDFVEKVQVPFTATSLGSISIPRDPLDQTQIMTEGFFPMISPVDDSSAATNQKFMVWAGNLKKYKIVDGTLKDASNNAIYKTENNEQKINSTAKDLWSIALSNDDHSSVSSGGALNKIPVPSVLNITSEPSKSDSKRNVFVVDGNSLKAVTKENLATDVKDTSALPADISVAQRYALMNYLGYSASMPTGATALTTSTLNGLTTLPQSPYRFMGGVVHSTPVLATQQAKIGSGSNAVASRTEYVVYGSMEGGLHIADATTGQEQSVFVPKEILNNQFNTLATKEPKGAGLVYGVDAPWLVDSQYKVKNTAVGEVTTTAYTANVLRAYGGLRMGGNGFYGLNISDVTAPKLLFHIHPAKTGFERLAQTWSKPTITDIRYKGKRTRVLIFGGGYDSTVYEDEATTNPTGPTFGNALYVVNAETGNLIWSTSSSISITNTTDKTKHADVKFSVVAQPAVRDYDSDGLADMIYFADMGGQIFRVDLNNLMHMDTTTKNIAVRVQKIASLAETNFTPRFYDRVTTAVFGSATERHVFVSVGSGNRSYPLQGSAVKNKIYGILDYDAAKNGIERSTYSAAFQDVATMGTGSNLLKRGTVGKNATGVSTLSLDGVSVSAGKLVDSNKASLLSDGTKRGWYFELTSKGDGTPSGSYYAKSFEEPQLVLGDLYVNVYDPKASLESSSDSCGGGVKGLSTIHRICAPYGDCAAHVKNDYQGIIGPTLGGLTNPARTTQLIGPITPAGEKCIGRCDSNTDTLTDQNLKTYSQSRTIRPTRWFEW